MLTDYLVVGLTTAPPKPLALRNPLRQGKGSLLFRGAGLEVDAQKAVPAPREETTMIHQTHHGLSLMTDATENRKRKKRRTKAFMVPRLNLPPS